VSRWSPEVRLFHLPVDASQSSVAGVPPWTQAVAMLASELDAGGIDKKTRVGCVVPSLYARYLLVPWNAAMQSRSARQVFAEHCFRNTYGELAANWVVRAGTGDYESATLACALDAALLDELYRMFAQRNLALRSVTPSLVHELGVLGDAFPGGATWLVVPEADMLTLLLVEQGQPRRVAIARGAQPQLPELLSREWFSLGREDRWTHVVIRPERSAPTVRAR
jgi:hypothetical protein